MSIALSIGNNLTTGGIFKPAAVNNTSINNVTDFAGVPAGGSLKLLSTQNASGTSSISFTSNIDSTYDSYLFKFINIHPSANARFQFQASTNGGVGYGVAMTTNAHWAASNEAGSDANLFYRTSEDLTNSTSDQYLTIEVGDFSGADESYSGTMQIFNPASTTFSKNFMITGLHNGSSYALNSFIGGYFDTTEAIDALIFRMSTGNIDDGTIKMYGVV